jgi:pyruvate dehydrogenase E2 component (dihydrolipoamide acetyltransferase)
MRMASPSGEDVVEDVPLTRIRQTIARRMQQSKQEAPHYYLQVDVDMTEAMAFRRQANEVLGEGNRATINDLIVLATAKALVQHPHFNAWWLEDHLQTHSQVNIGIAVELDEGLVVPCLLDCANKGLAQLALETRDLAERARAGRLRPEEYNATFSVSNLGGPQYGIDILVPIINPPQVGVLGVGAIVEKPVVRGGEIVVRSIMSVVLSADHRASDGADGALFLQSVKRNLETPGLMLL